MEIITKTQIKEKDVKVILDEIDDWYGVKISKNVLKRVLTKNVRLLKDLGEYGDIEYGLDTVTREDIINAISIDLIREEWPTGATKKRETEAFFKNFKRKAEVTNGYRVAKDWGHE